MRERLKQLSPRGVIKIYQNARFLLIRILMFLFRVFPIVTRRIVLMNVWGFGDNTKYVTEELSSSNIPCEIIFICNHPNKGEMPRNVKVVKTNTIAAIYALATAKVWVGSNRMERYISKRPGQYYIQLWHGGLALKKIEGDAASYLGRKYIKHAMQDSAMTDLYVSNSETCTRMYKRAFWYQGEISEWGSPRMDLLLRNNQSQVE